MANILFAGLIFGCIGSGAFFYGKKQRRAKHMILGALLMGYPYLIEDPVLLYAIGAVLTLALFISIE